MNTAKSLFSPLLILTLQPSRSKAEVLGISYLGFLPRIQFFAFCSLAKDTLNCTFQPEIVNGKEKIMTKCQFSWRKPWKVTHFCYSKIIRFFSERSGDPRMPLAGSHKLFRLCNRGTHFFAILHLSFIRLSPSVVHLSSIFTIFHPRVAHFLLTFPRPELAEGCNLR